MRAKTVRVRFENVGRGKKSWEADVREDLEEPGVPDADALIRHVRLGRALASRDIEVSANSRRDGGIFAGMRPVGTWRIVEVASRPSSPESSKET